MKKKETVVSAINLVIAVLHLILAVIAILKLPETIPTHFNLNWVCDSEGSRMPLAIVAVLPLVSGIAGIFWLRSEKVKQKPVMSILLLVIGVYLSVVFWLIYPTFKSGAHIGEQIDPQGFATLLPLLLGAMFIAMGNYMPVIRPNKTMGFRIPWTLNNPNCWRVTHRFAGRLMVTSGLVLCAVFLAAYAMHKVGALWSYYLLFVFTSLNVVLPTSYAYRHRND